MNINASLLIGRFPCLLRIGSGNDLRQSEAYQEEEEGGSSGAGVTNHSAEGTVEAAAGPR